MMRKTNGFGRIKGPNTQARRGAMLVLALFFIVSVTSLTVLILSLTSQTLRTARSEHEWLIVRQLTDSAKAWLVAHDGLGAVPVVSLPGDALLPDGSSGEARIRLEDGSTDVFVVAVTVSFPPRRISHETRFRLPVTGP